MQDGLKDGVIQKPRLLDQVRTRLRTLHYSLRTEQAYTHWIKRFIYFHNKRHPADMGGVEVERFLSSLAVAKCGCGYTKTGIERVVVSLSGSSTT